jgi:hypothetical protein
MKASPARLPEGPGALIVPDASTGKELFLTEVGYKTLQTSLTHEDQATRIASGSLFAASLFTGLAASSFMPALLLLPLVPLVGALGALWGRSSYQRKLSRLGRGQIPRHGVLGGGRREVFFASLWLLLALSLPLPPSAGLTLFLVAASAAIGSYGFLSRKLSREVGQAFEVFDQETMESLEMAPGDLTILGQGDGEQGKCPVCGDALGTVESSVFCELCGTGHHPECWSYAGRCSVFGCQGENVQSRF